MDSCTKTESDPTPPTVECHTAQQIPGTSSTNPILQTIQALCATLENKIGEVGMDITLLRQDMLNLVNRVDEGHTAKLKDTIQNDGVLVVCDT